RLSDMFGDQYSLEGALQFLFQPNVIYTINFNNMMWQSLLM
ncbi:2578_t:CDS:1, partial [Funneliformis mosseae]